MDHDAAAREHANMIEAGALICGQVPDALIRREHGVALVITRLPYRIFNQVIVERDDAQPARVADAVERARDAGARFVLHLREGTDDRLLPLVREMGLVALSPDPLMPGMALGPIEPEAGPPLPSGYEIRHVLDAAGVEDHVQVAIAGFEIPEYLVRAIVTPPLATHPQAAVYVGYRDGAPVSCGLGIRSGRTIGLYNIATIESARRHGYAEAMTRRIAADGARAGCDLAILQASDMGRPVYERIGYRAVVAYRGWIDPGS